MDGEAGGGSMDPPTIEEGSASVLRPRPDARTRQRCHDRHVPRTVVLVDDHAGFRAQARSLLEGAGYDVVGEGSDGASAIASARALRPDVVVLDVQLPDIDGFEVARALHASPDPPVIILISSREATDYGGRIAESPARGFVSKTELSAPALGALLEDAT
jgi:DNA-binding NarL/FixJ family response regulator